MDTEILFEALPFIRVYKSSRVERFYGTEVIPPSLDSLTGVSSKDAVAIPSTGVSVRLYLPKLPASVPEKRLPLLVYFHGGGFCLGSAFNSMIHTYLTNLANEGNVVIASVDYRLAPEHPVPVAFDDSWAALQWLAGAGADEWLTQHADFERVYLAGESAGATIAHQVAMRVGSQKMDSRVRVSGLVLIHPYFLGTDLVASDIIDLKTSEMLRDMWLMVCPTTNGLDDLRINPLAGGGPELSGMECKRVLVCVAGMDVLSDRGRAYCDGLRGSGWGGEVELLESGGEGHAFHLYKTTSDKALEMNRAICLFINSK